MKMFAGWKTFLLGLLLILIGGLEHSEVLTLIPDQYDALATQVIGLLVIGLRVVTNSPIFRRN